MVRTDPRWRPRSLQAVPRPRIKAAVSHRGTQGTSLLLFSKSSAGPTRGFLFPLCPPLQWGYQLSDTRSIRSHFPGWFLPLVQEQPCPRCLWRHLGARSLPGLRTCCSLCFFTSHRGLTSLESPERRPETSASPRAHNLSQSSCTFSFPFSSSPEELEESSLSPRPRLPSEQVHTAPRVRRPPTPGGGKKPGPVQAEFPPATH